MKYNTEFDVGEKVFICYYSTKDKKWILNKEKIKIIKIDIVIRYCRNIIETYTFDELVNNEYFQSCSRCKIFKREEQAVKFIIDRNSCVI